MRKATFALASLVVVGFAAAANPFKALLKAEND